MRFVFRQIVDSSSAEAGALYLQPAADADCQRRDLAALVLERGIGCLRQGAGPISEIVVGADPTLDEMLAATIVRERLAGHEIPAGLAPFARYATLAREGLTPSKLSLETSLEGIYLAIRGAAGENLGDPSAARRFIADWERMAAVIWKAAAARQDPFTTSLFAEGAEFARERAFLANDHAVYAQDLKRGEQWDVCIPGGPPRGRALLLRQPKSLLFKQWSRSETESGAGHPFLLLAVRWGPSQWVFTTDPVQRLPIKSLADALQSAELAAAGDAGKSDRWFDGKPFGHTLVAAPRQGTKLDERQVLGIVKRWSRPQGLRAGRRTVLATAAAAAIAVVAVCWHFFNPPPANSAARGLEFLKVSSATADEPVAPRDGRDYALIFATDIYDHWPKLCNAQSDARTIANILRDKYGFDVELCLDCTNDQFAGKFSSYVNQKQFQPNDQLFVYIAGHGERIGRKGYLVAKDSLGSREDIGKRTKSYYSLADLRNDIELISQRCGHVFLVLDTCFGGMIDFDTATESANRGEEKELTPAPKSEIIARKMKHHCSAFLTSVGKRPATDGRCGSGAGDETHSPFAERLIKLLGAVKPGDLVTIPNFVIEVDQDEKQEPRYGLLKGSEAGGDFLFVRK